MTWYVYALCEPTTGAMRYVGKSSNPAKRFAAHLSSTASESVRAWVTSLAAPPRLEIIVAAPTEAEAALLEQKWIAKLRASGSKLLNRTRGGEAGGLIGHRTPKFTGIAVRVRECRLALGMSQNDLAICAGVDAPKVCRLEKGHRTQITADSAVLLARALDVSVEWLVTGEERIAKAAAE